MAIVHGTYSCSQRFYHFFQGSNAEICVGIFYTVKWPENDNQTLTLRRKHLWMSEIYDL